MKKQSISAVALGLGLCGLTLAPFAEATQGTNVVLHKLAYQNKATETKNTGDVMDIKSFGTEARPWNNATDGTVQFTAYKLDHKQLNLSAAPQTVADEVAKAVKENTTLPYGATKVGAEVKVDDQGLATFTGLEEGTYVFVETTVSGIVKTPAKPLLVSLPMANKDGRSNKSQVELYPKNQYQEAEVSFIKYLQAQDKADPEVMKDEKSGFWLYKGEPGGGTQVENSFQALTNGSITVKGLTVGKYYFVEQNKDKDGQVSDQFGPNKVMYDTDVANTPKNRLTFEYTADGKIIFPDNSLLKEGEKVINYEKPSVTKTKDKTTAGFDEDITYMIQSDVPINIAKYTEYALTDTPDEAIVLDKSTLALKAGEKSVTFTTEDTDHGLKVVPNLEELKALPKGSTLTLTYKAHIDGAKAKIASDMTNTVKLDYNNNLVKAYEEKATPIKTYEAVLKKVDGGLFNSGIIKQPLKGAKFIIGKKADNTYLKVDNGKYSWVKDKAQATEMDTNDQGLLTVKGLGNGDYFFEETQAPTGYHLNPNTISDFTIKDANASGDQGIEVTNNRQPDMPMTGTEVTALVLVGLGGTIAVVTLVKRHQEAKTK